MLYPDFHDLMSLKQKKFKSATPSYRLVKSAVAGGHHSPFRGQGMEFDSVREYIPGDDVRSIDWRVTARTSSPHLKVFKVDRERQITLCVDFNAAMRFGTRNTFKSVQAARVASLLGWQGIARQDRVGGCLFGDVPNGIQLFSPKRTEKSFCTFLKMLATPLKEEHAISLEKIFKQLDQISHSGSLIYVISDFMNIGEHLLNNPHINRLSKRCMIVFIAINDPADCLLLPVGIIGACSYGSCDRFAINTQSVSSREAYAAQWKENRRLLRELTFRLKIPLLELTTESLIHRDLAHGLKNIVKGKKQ